MNCYAKFVALPFGHILCLSLTIPEVNAVLFATRCPIVSCRYNLVIVDNHCAISPP